MSEARLIGFKEDGSQETITIFKNAYSGAFEVWASIFRHHINKVEDRYQYDGYEGWSNFIEFKFGREIAKEKRQKFWDLWKHAGVSDSEAAVFMSTFDRAIITAEYMRRFIYDLHRFRERHGNSRLNEYAYSIDWLLMNRPDIRAVGFAQHSTSNPWQVREQNLDRLYNMKQDTGHFSVYEWIAEDRWDQCLELIGDMLSRKP